MHPKLDPLLDALKQITLSTLAIDVLEDKISLDLKKRQEQESLSVKFDGVSSFFFIDESKNSEHDRTLANIDVNSIAYYEGGLGEFSTLEEDYGDFGIKMVTIPNFAVEMKDSSLFIEADYIEINGERFDVSTK
ncbi:MAG: hypothetical protein JXO44_11325 [Clostridia bacterium]|nr:hypothetical protein [Clostridia bacterium]